ncbi:hypothetical protein ACSLBF_18570 (plasmid) [Pseudoalteromonas sp. T1lg65]|uniref:hypothetical protein n=1 Tax=Pseudoalteromonas sp. T1lg65 TaxID=2077101 RepID=UPI003F7B0982
MTIKSALLVSLSLFATAAAAQPLITKTSGSGFVMPDYVKTETCEVFSNYVKVDTQYGVYEGRKLSTSETINQQINNHADINKLIALAAEEELAVTGNYICDAPGTAITASYFDANTAEYKDVVLFRSGGCGSDRLERNGPFSNMLKSVVNKHCPTTHDYQPSNTDFPVIIEK